MVVSVYFDIQTWHNKRRICNNTLILPLILAFQGRKNTLFSGTTTEYWETIRESMLPERFQKPGVPYWGH